MARQILSACTSQQHSQFTSGGYSVTTGQGNYFINHIPLSWNQSFNPYSHMSVFLCKSEMWSLVAVLPSRTDGAYQTFGAQIPMSSHGILQ